MYLLPARLRDQWVSWTWERQQTGGGISKEHPPPIPGLGAGICCFSCCPQPLEESWALPLLPFTHRALEHSMSRKDTSGLNHASKAGKKYHLSTEVRKAFPWMQLCKFQLQKTAALDFRGTCLGTAAERSPEAVRLGAGCCSGRATAETGTPAL